MRRFFYIIAALFFVPVFAQEIPERKDETAFKTGEELKYRLRYGFLTAAEATLKVESTNVKFNNRPVYHLIAHGKTAGTFDVFYKIRNRYDSYIDKKELIPYLFTENVREGNYKRDDKVRFHQDQKKIIGRKGTFTGKNRTFDMVSAYYFARNLDLNRVQKGQKFILPYFLNDGVENMEIQYMGKERVKTPMGHFDCLKFSPSIQPGRVFRKDSKLYLWITDDENRIPVKAHVELVVGAVTVEIKSASNLKYPLLLAKNK